VTERACTVILRTSAAWQHIINNRALSRANDAERECRIHNARAPPDPEKRKSAPPNPAGRCRFEIVKHRSYLHEQAFTTNGS
jgi:hypothetical protein